MYYTGENFAAAAEHANNLLLHKQKLKTWNRRSCSNGYSNHILTLEMNQYMK